MFWREFEKTCPLADRYATSSHLSLSLLSREIATRLALLLEV
jgi:hypothetical protein